MCERLSVTICALHIPVARIFGSKFLECPHSSISGMLVWTITTPPPRKCRFGQILALRFELVWTTTPPPQTCRFGQIMALWDYARTGVWRLIAVSPKDTVLLLICATYIPNPWPSWTVDSCWFTVTPVRLSTAQRDKLCTLIISVYDLCFI